MNIVRKYGRIAKAWYFRQKYNLHNIDKTVYIGGKGSISSDLHADKYVFIGPHCEIYPNVSIGAYTLLAHDVRIMGGDHLYKKVGTPIIFSGRDTVKPTHIGMDCWIGSYSIIMSGVNIGNGSIIAAGAVVTKDVEPFSIYGGVPAKKIKDRFESEEDKQKHIKSIMALPDKVSLDMFCGDIRKSLNDNNLGGGNWALILCYTVSCRCSVRHSLNEERRMAA